MADSSVDLETYSLVADLVDKIRAYPEAERPAAAERLLAEHLDRDVLRDAVRAELGLDSPTPAPEWKSELAKYGYSLVRIIGRGGQGVVCLAHLMTDAGPMPVALKLVRLNGGNFDAIKREVQLQQQAGQHTNVLPVINVFRVGAHAVIASELASDGSLADLLKKRNGAGFPVGEALAILFDALRGIEHMHGKQIVHRDLKPANVLNQNGTFRLTDFGVARAHSDANPQEVVGTQPYLPPEVLTVAPLPPPMRDLWAAGVMLYELLTGSRPHPNGVFKWKPPPELPIEVPQVVRDIVTKALSEKPKDRYQTATEMLDAVKQAQRWTRPLSGRSAAIAVTVAKKQKRSKVLVGMMAAVGAALAVGVYVLFFAERIPVESTEFSVPTALHLSPTDLGHRIRNGVVTSVNPRVSDCQARGVGRGVGGLGSLTLSFTVRPDGRVEDVNVDGTAPMDAVMRRCFVRAAAQRQFDNWTFDRVVARADYEFVTAPAAPHRATRAESGGGSVAK